MDTSLFALSIDQWIVVTFLVATLIVGIVSGLKIKTVRDYTIGEKGSFPASVIAMTLVATMIGGNGTIGYTAELFKYGYIHIVVMAGYVIGLLLLAKFVASKFDNRFDGMLSSADIIGKFCGKKAEKFTGIVGAISGIGIVGAQITALAHFSAHFLYLSYNATVIIMGGILVIYSAFGGIRSVTMTDVMQFFILAIGIPIIANLCFQEIGGFDNMISKLPESHTKILEHENFEEYFMLFIFYMFPFIMLWAPLVQRYLMAKDAEQISKVTYLYAFLAIALGLMTAYIAFSSVQLFPNLAPNLVISNAINEFIPIGLKGIAIAGMMAVIMSTADSMLNASGILITLNTFFAPDMSDTKKIWLMKLNTLIIGIIAIIIALQNISIFHIIIVSKVLIAMTTIPLFMKIIGLEVRAEQFWANVILGVIVFFVAKIAAIDNKVCSFISAISSVLAFIITHLIQNGGRFKHDCYEKEQRKRLFNKSIIETIKDYIPTLDKLANYSIEKVKDIGAPYQLFGIFTCVNYVVPYFMWSFDKFPNQEYLTVLRFAAGGLCVLLMMADQWHRKVEKYLPLYWHFTVMFCLPFMTTVMFFCTQAQHGWLINMMLAIFFLSVLVDWKTFIILNATGIILGSTFYKYFIGVPTVILDTETIYLMVYAFIFSTFIGMLFAKKREALAGEKVEVVQMFAGVMAHELRAPIGNCKMSIETLVQILDSAQSKEKNDEITFKMHKMDYEMIQTIKEHLMMNVDKGTQLIDMSLMASKAAVIADDKDDHSMQETAEEAIEEMPLLPEDREKVSIEVQEDFAYYGSKKYMIHVIWNLVGNAFKYGLTGKPDARIKVIVADGQLMMKDTGKGIDKKDLSKIFERFYTTSASGTGIGLAFCKMVVEDCGGSISCNSTAGEHTTFV